MKRSKRSQQEVAIPNTSVYPNRQRVGTFIAEDRRSARRVRKTFATEQEAWRYLGSADAVARGTAGTMSLARWMSMWLANLDPDLAPSTVTFYEYAADKWAGTRVGGKQLVNITSDDIEAQLREWLSGAGLQHGTVMHLKRVLSTALNEAARRKYLSLNPVVSVRRVGKAPARRISTITLGLPVMRQLSNAWVNHPLRLAFEILLHTGMRPGELLVLTWNDISLEAKEIHIQRGLQIIRKKSASPGSRGSVRWRAGTTKTASSNRRIAFDDQLLRLLFKAYRAAGSPKGENGNQWIFPRADDPAMPISRDHLSHSFKKVVTEARIGFRPGQGTSQYRLYDLRGLHATLLINKGWDPVRVASRLGHTDIVSTFRRYAGTVTERDREGLEDARLWPNQSVRSGTKAGAEGGD